MTRTEKVVFPLLLDVRSKTVNRAKDLKESAEMPRRIYSAIRRRDVAAATAAMRDHLLRAETAQAEEETKNASTLTSDGIENGLEFVQASHKREALPATRRQSEL